MAKGPRLLIVGFDAATLSLAGKWMDQGRLPNLASMREGGAFGLLHSTPNMHSAAAWSSIITGLNPGRHGIFNFNLRRWSDNRQIFYNGGDRKGDTLPELLNRQGLTMGMVNVPMTYPAVKAKGFMISGLDAPSLDEKAFYPRELRDEVFSRFPDYASVPEGIGHLLGKKDLAGAVDLWKKLIRTRTRLCEHLLAEHPVDAFMVTYTASDWVGHYFWRFTDPDHPDHDGALADRYLNTIRDFYADLDKALGRLMKLVAPGGHVMVVSDHGMGPHSRSQFHLAHRLAKNGYMRAKLKEGPSLRGGLRRAAGALPGVVGRKATTFVDMMTKSDRDQWYDHMDWSATRAYSEVGRKWININLKGRNLHGIVEKSDYDGLVEELRRDLLGWKDPKTGRPFIEAVRTKAEMYDGPYTELANDLLVFPDTSVYHRDELPGSVTKKGYWWSGEHVDQGVIFVKGPGIRPGSKPDEAIVYDVVPTAAFLCGEGVPSGLDGRVLRELLTDDARAAVDGGGGGGSDGGGGNGGRSDGGGGDGGGSDDGGNDGGGSDGGGGKGDGEGEGREGGRGGGDGDSSARETDEERKVRERLEGLGYL